MVQKIYYALATMIALTGAIFFFMASPASADTLSIVCDKARIPRSLSNHSACSSAVSTLPGDVIILEGKNFFLEEPVRLNPQQITFSGKGQERKVQLTPISRNTLDVVGGNFVVAAVVPDDLPAGVYTLSIGIQGKCYQSAYGARTCPTSTGQSSITIASITGTSEFDFTCLATDYTENTKNSCSRSSGFQLSLKGLRGVSGNSAIVYLRKKNEYFLGRKIDLNKNAGQITYWMPDATGKYEIVVRNRAVTGRAYPGDQEVVGPTITIIEPTKKKVVEGKGEWNLPAGAKTEISIIVATYITDNNTAFAPRIQRNIPGSLIPGQPFAVKVKHINGPLLTQQHKVKMELRSLEGDKTWNLGTFEVNSHESIGTLKEDKKYNTQTSKLVTSQWYIWHNSVPYEFYDELKNKKVSSQEYTLIITAIDETPFIKEDNYEASTPVTIEIPKLFSPSTEGYNKGLLVSPKKPELAKDIIITPGSPLILRGSNFPPGAKLTKVYFGQRKWWQEDNRAYVAINKLVPNNGILEETIDISRVENDLIAQQGGKTDMQISVEIEETVTEQFVDFEKRMEEFKKYENSENGKHIFDIVGVAKIAPPDKKIEPPIQRPDTTTPPTPPTPKQDAPQPPAGSQRVFTQEELKKWREDDLWRDPITRNVYIKKEAFERRDAEQKKNPCAYPETLSFSEKIKCQMDASDEKPTSAPKPKPAPSVERVQEEKITTDCEDVISFWRKPGENCVWKDKPATEEPAKPAPAPTPAPKVELKSTPIEVPQENPCAGKEGYQLSQCKFFYGITDDKKPEAKKPEPKKDEPKKETPKIEEPKVEEQKKEEPKQDQEVKYCDPTKPMFWQRGCVDRPEDQKKEITYCSPDKPITFQPGCVERP